MARSAGLILFAHGARDPEWAQPFRDIAARVSAARPGLSVRLAFLELQTPALPETVAELVTTGHRTIHVAPLFMAQGAHLRHDLPKLLDDVRGRHPGLDIGLLPAIGDVPGLREAIAGWLAATVPGAPA